MPVPDKIEELRDKMGMYEALLKNPTFQSLRSDLEAQLRYRRESLIEAPLNTLDSFVNLASIRGEIAGIHFAMNQVDYILTDLRKEYEDALEEDRLEETE